MNNLSVFQFDGQEIRFIEGKPVANDVARVLGYADPASTVSKKVEPGYKSVAKTVTVDGKLRDIIVLEEPGIYQLIFGSKLPSAEKFRKWVFEEVLVSIRKTGQYSTNQLKDVNWYNRLILYKQKTVIPVGYFSIFAESTCGLIADFETIGYILPENATIDISIGQHWASYAKTQVKNIEDFRTYYSHFYPDARGEVQAYMYKLDLLPMFRIWAETDYKMNHLASYLKKKDRQALYVLADLMGMPLLPNIVDELTNKRLSS